MIIENFKSRSLNVKLMKTLNPKFKTLNKSKILNPKLKKVLRLEF